MACYRLFSTKVSKQTSTLSLDSMNQALVYMEHSIRSHVHMRYMEHHRDMMMGLRKPFEELVPANLGDAQRFGQPPLTFLRQMLALCLNQDLADSPRFPEDVKRRAKRLMAEFPHGSVGSLTDPQGLFSVRSQIAEYIRNRDGVPSSPENIVLADCGKSVDALFNLLKDTDDDSPVGVLIPIPTYPIYSSVISKHGLSAVGYYLDEDKNWDLDIKELKNTIANARCECRPKALVVINPGNPAGNILSREKVEDVVRLCYDESLFIMADEVYQQNVHGPGKFYSFKMTKHKLGPPFCDLELVSMHSASKGYTGECGMRGGYMEFDGFEDEVKAAFLKAISLYGCPNVAGQVALGVLVKPPEPGDPSCELYEHEKATILDRLRYKASLVVDRLNKIEGVKVNPMQAGLFAFARIDLPDRAIAEAKKRNIEPSLFWALQLLDSTGIAVAPGNIFRQKPNTYHFRVTIVPPIEVLEKVIKGIDKFQKDFVQTYK